MKKNLLLSLALAIASITAMAQAPAFPGAEGFARYTTTGGRGGKVIHVTNLNDSGTGSLRAAISQKGSRIIVFDVSGIIELKSTLKINNGDVTIMGQTAPGDGICLKNYTLNINASNVIVRYIRSRMGDAEKDEDDAMNSYFHDGNEKENIIIDHCSMSWSTDECGSFYGIKNFTLQWCVLSESLRISIHDKGAHGYGGIWGGSNALYSHNLLAHHDNRNARLDHDYVSTLKGPLDYINNVVYNWGNNSTYGGESANTTNTYKKYNMINNYYKYGKATKSSARYRLLNPTTKCSNCTNAMKCSTIVPGHFYLSGNYMYGSTDVTNDNWQGVHPDEDSKIDQMKATTRFLADDGTEDIMTLHSAQNAFDKVLLYAGASYKRDAVDQRVTRETRNGTYTYNGSGGSTGGMIDRPSDVGGWPEYVSKTALTDSDNDGMPDVWETANGLNPNDASDATAYTIDKNGYYTNIEVYCNSLVEDLVKAQNADAVEAVDEYYPATTKAAGVLYYDGSAAEGGYPTTPDQGETATSYTISSETATCETGATTWTFNGGISVSGGGGYATAPNGYIKFSRNKQFTITLPSGFSVAEVTFTGYCNVDDNTSYLGELNGTTYSETQYTFPARNASPASATHTIKLATPATGSFTFEPKGDAQSCFIITLKSQSSSTGIAGTAADGGRVVETSFYNLQGQRVAEATTGVVIKVEKLDTGKKRVSKVIMR